VHVVGLLSVARKQIQAVNKNQYNKLIQNAKNLKIAFQLMHTIKGYLKFSCRKLSSINAKYRRQPARRPTHPIFHTIPVSSTPIQSGFIRSSSPTQWRRQVFTNEQDLK